MSRSSIVPLKFKVPELGQNRNQKSLSPAIKTVIQRGLPASKVIWFLKNQ